jgi:hypothetical protein
MKVPLSTSKIVFPSLLTVTSQRTLSFNYFQSIFYLYFFILSQLIQTHIQGKDKIIPVTDDGGP